MYNIMKFSAYFPYSPSLYGLPLLYPGIFLQSLLSHYIPVIDLDRKLILPATNISFIFWMVDNEQVKYLTKSM